MFCLKSREGSPDGDKEPSSAFSHTCLLSASWRGWSEVKIGVRGEKRRGEAAGLGDPPGETAPAVSGCPAEEGRDGSWVGPRTSAVMELLETAHE